MVDAAGWRINSSGVFEVPKKVAAEDSLMVLRAEPYRAIVDTMTEGAVILADSGDIIYSNDCFASLIGCPLRDLAGHTFSRYVTPADQSHFSNLLVYASERPGRAEVNLLKADGGIVSASLSAAPLKSDELRGIYIIVSDVSLRRRAEENLIKAHAELEELVKEKHSTAARATAELRKEAYERKRVEARLTEQEERFRLLLENASDIIMVLKDRAVAYAAPSLQRMLEFEPNEVTGQDFFTLVHKDDRRKACESLDEGKRIPGCSFCFEARMTTKSGTCRRMELTGKNLLHDERIKGIVLNARDVSNQKRM